jgi:uncharacterized Zn finger protein
MSWGWGWYPRPKPRRPAHGIRAKTGRGQQFGKTWWAGKWIDALERLVDPGRLTRGRSYARSGQVLNLDLKPGRVDSRVQGSLPQPYKVRIEIEPLTDKEWNKVTDAMAAQAVFAAKLLAGEMPQNIEAAFATAKVSLFPGRKADLDTDCSCPDWANPCKHIAAVYYLLGERFDEDPFLIFQLRGRTKAQIIAALRARRTAGGAEPERKRSARARQAEPEERVIPLAESLQQFWAAGDELEMLRFTIATPEVEAAPVKQLGEPPFWPGQPGFLAQMSRAYAAITREALASALGEQHAV